MSELEGFGLQFDHFGLATRHPERRPGVLRGLGHATQPAVFEPLQRVNLDICSHAAMPDVEVITPGLEPGALASILAQRPESVYHLCFRSADVAASLAASLAAMRADGHRVLPVSPPKPARLFGQLRVSFHMLRGLGLIEIIETAPTVQR